MLITIGIRRKIVLVITITVVITTKINSFTHNIKHMLISVKIMTLKTITVNNNLL